MLVGMARVPSGTIGYHRVAKAHGRFDRNFYAEIAAPTPRTELHPSFLAASCFPVIRRPNRCRNSAAIMAKQHISRPSQLLDAVTAVIAACGVRGWLGDRQSSFQNINFFVYFWGYENGYIWDTPKSVHPSPLRSGTRRARREGQCCC